VWVDHVSQQESDGGHLESAHVCQRCQHVINLAEIDLRSIRTGIVGCPKCDWSGAVEIRIVSGFSRS
jgi:hypothetical protein